MSTYSSVFALYPKSPEPSATLATTTEPSRPAFSTIVLNGASTARETIWIPVASSALSAFKSAKASLALNKATPPPATIPSSTAARVACKASSTLSFFSFISTSEAAPT
ncbi:hypothetical protein D3C87_1059260 [compost metagenome]